MLPGCALTGEGKAFTELGMSGAAAPEADFAGAGRAREAAPAGGPAWAAFAAAYLARAASAEGALLTAWLPCALLACRPAGCAHDATAPQHATRTAALMILALTGRSFLERSLER